MCNKKNVLLVWCLFISSAAFCMGNRASGESENLALYRPATASSVGYFPTPTEFAVDGQIDTGWRSVRAVSDTGDWLTVDLEAVCSIDSVCLVWASNADKPVFEEVRTSALFGDEQVSAYGLEYAVSISKDGKQWETVYTATNGNGGTDEIQFEPVKGRFVRVTIEKRSHTKVGVGINELAVMGTCKSKRPPVDSWIIRRKPKVKPVYPTVDPKSTEVLLDSGWELMRQDWEDLNAEKVTHPTLDTSRWYNATVPGTVMTTLVDQGVFDEPTIGTNNLKIPESLCRHDWWYRTELQVPAEWMKGDQRLWLQFDSINRDAEIWLDDKCVGMIHGGFMRGQFDITDAVDHTSKHILAVRIIPPAHPGVPMEKNEWDRLYNGGALGKDSPTFLASIGWDWLPPVRDRGIGIWGPVRLCRTGLIKIEDSQIITDLPLPKTDTADISISVPVRNQSDQMQKVTVKATFDNIKVSQLIVVPAGGVGGAKFSPQTHPELTVKNPRLWWPAGYGEQNLYDLTLSAVVEGNISDTQTSRFGIRELSYRGSLLNTGKKEDENRGRIKFSPVQARYVRLNCLQRATKYGFSLYTLSVFNSQHPEKDLARGADIKASSIESNEHPAVHAVDGNADTRWASARSEPQWLAVDLGQSQTIDRVRIDWEVAYAKQFTVQVSEDGQTWVDVEGQMSDEPQDLEISVNGQRVLCRGGNWGYPEMLIRLSDQRQEISVKLHREANFTMIRNWIGMSTNKAFYDLCDEYGILIWNDFWLANPGDGPNPDNEALFMSNVEDAILRFRNHPSIAIWCGRNEGMPPEALDQGMRKLTGELDGTRFYQSHSSDVGVNGGGPYKYMPPERYFDDLNHGFKTELGMPSVPSAESMRKMLDDPDPWPMDVRWAYHDFCPKGNQYRDEYNKAIDENFGAAVSVDDYCKKAQMINYEGYRAIFEGANHKLWNDCSGVLLWMSHPAWPSTVWQVYDYWYGTDGAYFGSKKANEPIHIQLCRLDGTVEMINHTASKVSGTVKAKVLSLDAAVLWETSKTLTANQDSKTDAFKIEWPDQLPQAYFVYLQWTDQKGGVLSENMYWLSSKKGGLKALNDMPTVQLKSKVIQKEDCRITVEVTNLTKKIAFMTKLILRDATTGQRILPAFYSDNYLSLLPGQSKQVVITSTAADAGKTKNVSIEGWNIEPDQVK